MLQLTLQVLPRVHNSKYKKHSVKMKKNTQNNFLAAITWMK